MNDTILKFQYPEFLIKEYENWVVLFRSNQVTLGALVLAYKPNVESLSDVNKVGFLELETIIKDIEQSLKRMFDYDKINYLTLMMQDKQVHMHVIPRYSSQKKNQNKLFLDPGWPGVPDLKYTNELLESELFILKEYVKNNYHQN